MPQRPDRVITSAAAAKILGVSVSTAQQWINREILPSWRTPGGHRRLFVGDVMELAARLKSTGGNPAPLPQEFLPAHCDSIPVPGCEAERLAALHQSDLVDTPPDPAFDRIGWLAGQLCDCPMALVTLLTSSRQWFKARLGVALTETPRDMAFCSYTIMGTRPFTVEDATADPRFASNPLVVGEPHIRFYAGFPVFGMDDLPLGALCVLDREPRRLRQRELTAMQHLADLTSEHLLRHGMARTHAHSSRPRA